MAFDQEEAYQLKKEKKVDIQLSTTKCYRQLKKEGKDNSRKRAYGRYVIAAMLVYL